MQGPLLTCSGTSDAECIGLNGTWFEGEACLIEFWSCDRPACNILTLADPPENTANCQLPAIESVFGEGFAPPVSIIAASSDLNPIFDDLNDPVDTGRVRADDFVATDSPITTVCWWGIYADLDTSGPNDGRCQVTDSFTITYYLDDGDGCPMFP